MNDQSNKGVYPHMFLFSAEQQKRVAQYIYTVKMCCCCLCNCQTSSMQSSRGFVA